MKNLVLALGVVFCLCSFKGDVLVNPEFFGTWRSVKKDKKDETKIHTYTFTFKQNAKSNKIEIYRKSDPDGKPFVIVKMEDATHFKGHSSEKVDDNQTKEYEITGYYENKGFIIKNHTVVDIYSAGQTHKKAYDHVYLVRKFDNEKNSYIDFPDLGANVAFDNN